ncbi:hypothetical protein ACVBIO_03665 [Shewanella sp. 0m-8]
MLTNYCPNCGDSISFKHRLVFIYREIIECNSCGATVTPTITGGFIGVPFGAITWYWVDVSLQAVGTPSVLSAFFGFLSCMLIIRLGYVFSTIITFDN